MLLAFTYDEGIQNATGSSTKKKNNETRTIEVYTNHHCNPTLLQRYYIYLYIIPSKLFWYSPSHCTSAPTMTSRAVAAIA